MSLDNGVILSSATIRTFFSANIRITIQASAPVSVDIPANTVDPTKGSAVDNITGRFSSLIIAGNDQLWGFKQVIASQDRTGISITKLQGTAPLVEYMDDANNVKQVHMVGL